MRPSPHQRRAASKLSAPTKITAALAAFLVPFIAILATSPSAATPTISAAPADYQRTVHVETSRSAERLDLALDPAVVTFLQVSAYLHAVAPRPATQARRGSAPAALVVATTYATTASRWCKNSASATAQVEQWRPHVAAYPDWPVETMMRFICVESTGDPYDRNPRSSATGLFGILGGSTDGLANIAEAHSMWLQRGTEPWTCCE